ncbi:DUF4395 domain-containing protein [Actinoplanes regularis]|uniref:DUF4395 domain-containing protein n=1 Tax=Actinoplanes regularis TaxID=52697 RepID=A0A238WJ30_9ACTN|nr:DUF4395 domain-containing protein [Actinoplanes regularis]GIE84825.1 membrane protein [Actinoplanes regularis]GLW32445.1 membrane protein [Actinoplanes regularis]SNR46596.1 protein of unknown function [Actinoplanes regularis]
MELDPRGQRFAATLTSIVIALVLITGSGWLALAQAVVFAITAYRPQRGPYALIFKKLIRPRLGGPAELEPAAPVRFAQLVGFAFLSVSAGGYLAGAETLGLIAAAFGLLAAFLNAAFGLCLGCEAYLGIRRLTGRNAESVENV